jgi:acylglycerol lipase
VNSERTEFLKTFDGTDLFFRCFTPRGKSAVEGVILAVHGFAEHSGRYADLAEDVCKKGLAFVSFDLRGHGKSGPRRGDAENLHAMILDVLFVANHTRSLLGLASKPDVFLGLFGHSFGGLLCTYAAAILRESCPPLFLSSPLYGIKQEVPAWKKFAADQMHRLAPLAPVPHGIHPENISRNPENNAAYVADERNLSSVSARFGHLFLSAVNSRDISFSASCIKAPITICYGELDTLVDGEKTQQVFPLFPSRQKKLLKIPQAGHEIFNETPPVRALAVQELMAWIEARGMVGNAT